MAVHDEARCHTDSGVGTAEALLHTASVIANRDEGGGCFRLILGAPQAATAVKPGQFIHLRCGDAQFLRRPISVADADPQRGTLTLLIRRVGAGTEWLATRRPGDALDFIGPLGNSFPVEADREWWLVAGGIGWAPLRLLLRTGERLGVKVRVFYGARSVSGLIGLTDLAPRCAEFNYATDDGSFGQRGTVMDILPASAPAGVTIFACGPQPLLKAVAGRYATGAASVYLSLEERMACGVGACLGCAVAVPSGQPRRVCVDGPIFAAKEVVL
jgi:dihydroorotate dehydrogenase electron transfer subunit